MIKLLSLLNKRSIIRMNSITTSSTSSSSSSLLLSSSFISNHSSSFSTSTTNSFINDNDTPMIKYMKDLLLQSISPSTIEHFTIIDESSGHASSKGNSHFRIVLVSSIFTNKKLIERHRILNNIYKPLMLTSPLPTNEEEKNKIRLDYKTLHALALVPKDPNEWNEYINKNNNENNQTNNNEDIIKNKTRIIHDPLIAPKCLGGEKKKN